MKLIHTNILYTLFIAIMLVGCSSVTYQTHDIREIGKGSGQHLYKEKIPLEFFPRTIEIVAIGDSLTKGVGSTPNSGGYLPYLEASLIKSGAFIDVNWHNYGVKGHRTDQLINTLEDKEIIAQMSKADVIIITIGGNDIMKIIRNNWNQLELVDFKEALPDYEKNIQHILERIRTINSEATVYLVGVYNPMSRLLPQIQEFNTITSMWNEKSQSHINRMQNMYFVDISIIFSEGMNVLYEEDFFHPNDLGYEKIAESIYDKIVESKKMDTWGKPFVHASGNEE